MAVLLESGDFAFLDHREALEKWIAKLPSHEVVPELFDIRTPFLMNAQAAKRAAQLEEKDVQPPSGYPDLISDNPEEVERIYSVAKDAVDRVRKELELLNSESSSEDLRANNCPAIRASRVILQSELAETLPCTRLDSGNSTDSWKNEEGFLLPPHSRYINGDWTEIASLDTKFDLVVMDPPWRNKFVRRVKRRRRSYCTFDNDELLKISGEQFLTPGGLLALWCPPSEGQMDWVKHVLLPHWKCELVGLWYWFKVTKSGAPVKEWKQNMTWNDKKSFEVLILARMSSEAKATELPVFKVLISVPSAIHSHKPPLLDVLRPWIKEDPCCAEVFARGLTPGWTSIGDQVLLLQNEHGGVLRRKEEG